MNEQLRLEHEHPMLELGIASHSRAGRTDSGDRHVCCPYPGGVLVGVLDGLGHGPEASVASGLAAATLEQHAPDSLAALVARCHEQLRRARGVTMSLASFRHQDSTMTWAGVGNVEGVLVRGDGRAAPSRQYLLLRAGVVGIQVTSLEPEILRVTAGDTLVFTTDGIRGNFFDMIIRGVPARFIANHILNQHHRPDDDALVLVARYLGNGL